MALKTTLEDTQDRLEALLTYANSVTGASDTSLGDAIETLANGYGSGGSSLPIQLELVGTWTGYKPELLSGSSDTIATGIYADASTYNHFIVTVLCDGEYDSTLEKEWGGLSICHCAKFNNGRVNRGMAFTYSKTKSLTFNSTTATSNMGINIKGSDRTFTVNRSADNNCPRVMGGNYTVNVYAIVGI